MNRSPARRRGFPARVVLLSICAASFPLCAASSRGSSGGAEWPHWRGPARDGKSPDVGLLKSWPSGGPRLLWRRDDIGTGYANVAVAGGKVFTAGLVGDEMVLIYKDLAVVTPGGSNCVVALDKATGRPAWTSTGLSDRPAYSSCIVFEHGGVPMIATMTSKPKPSIFKPRPRPRPAVKRTPAPARPDTPDERARRLWFLAKSFLANNATGLARKKLEEIVEKYPDTKYGPLAREKLKSID